MWYTDSSGKTAHRLIVSTHFKEEQITHRNARKPIIAYRIALQREKMGRKVRSSIRMQAKGPRSQIGSHMDYDVA